MNTGIRYEPVYRPALLSPSVMYDYLLNLVRLKSCWEVFINDVTVQVSPAFCMLLYL